MRNYQFNHAGGENQAGRPSSTYRYSVSGVGEEKIGIAIDAGNNKVSEITVSSAILFYHDVVDADRCRNDQVVTLFSSAAHRPACNNATTAIRKIMR